MLLIQSRIWKYIVGLADNAASPARAWSTSFVCRLLNSTREFVNWKVKSLLNSEIIWPNFETSYLLEWKASFVVLDSTTKSTLSICIKQPQLFAHKDWAKRRKTHSFCYNKDSIIITYTHANTCMIPSLRKRSTYVAFQSTLMRALPTHIRSQTCEGTGRHHTSSVHNRRSLVVVVCILRNIRGLLVFYKMTCSIDNICT